MVTALFQNLLPFFIEPKISMYKGIDHKLREAKILTSQNRNSTTIQQTLKLSAFAHVFYEL